MGAGYYFTQAFCNITGEYDNRPLKETERKRTRAKGGRQREGGRHRQRTGRRKKEKELDERRTNAMELNIFPCCSLRPYLN